MKLFLLGIILGIWTQSHAKSYDGYKLIRVFPAIHSHLNALQNLTKSTWDVQIWRYPHKLGQPMEMFVGPRSDGRLEQFLSRNLINHEIAVQDFGVLMGKYAKSNGAKKLADTGNFDFNVYHPYDEITQYLQQLAKEKSDFVSFDSIGKTFEKRETGIIKLGYPSESQSKPIFFLDAGIHAREWIASAVALKMVNAFVNEPKWNDLLKKIDMHIVPIANPDGYEYSRTTDRYWRTTRSGPLEATECDLVNVPEDGVCYGADPNRNFPFHWGEAGTDKCPCSEEFPGQSEMSEAESANIAQYLKANKDGIKSYMTLHSYSGLIMYPWSYQPNTYPEDVEELKELAQQMANAISAAGGDEYRIGSPPDLLYAASGDSTDYARDLGIKYAYAMELTKGIYEGQSVGFVWPEEGIEPESAKILEGLYVLAEKIAQLQ